MHILKMLLFVKWWTVKDRREITIADNLVVFLWTLVVKHMSCECKMAISDSSPDIVTTPGDVMKVTFVQQCFYIGRPQIGTSSTFTFIFVSVELWSLLILLLFMQTLQSCSSSKSILREQSSLVSYMTSFGWRLHKINKYCEILQYCHLKSSFAHL